MEFEIAHLAIMKNYKIGHKTPGIGYRIKKLITPSPTHTHNFGSTCLSLSMESEISNSTITKKIK